MTRYGRTYGRTKRFSEKASLLKKIDLLCKVEYSEEEQGAGLLRRFQELRLYRLLVAGVEGTIQDTFIIVRFCRTCED